MLNMYIWK